MTLSRSRLETARSLLLVPGDRPDRFAKAASAGADAVIVDLEDAVATQDKDRARENVAAWLGAGNSAVVRINAPLALVQPRPLQTGSGVGQRPPGPVRHILDSAEHLIEALEEGGLWKEDEAAS
jgi:hypothetical protein